MDALTELIELVTQKRIKKIELFDESSRNKNSNYFKLFDGIHSRKYKTDEEAAEDIYQCEASAKKYLILKTRLKQKLLNTLFFLDISKTDGITEREQAFYECTRILYHTRILLLNKNWKLAIPTLEKVLKRAQEYEITAIEYECANLLRKYYCEQNNYRSFLTYKEISEHSEAKMITENNSEKSYQELVAHYSKSRYSKEVVLRKAEEYALRIQEDYKKYKSNTIRDNYLKIRTLIYKLSHDYSSTLQVLEEREKHQNQAPKFFSYPEKEDLQMDIMNTFLHLKDFDNAEEYVKHISNIEEGSDTWFKMQEYRVLTGVHTENYELAATTFKSVLHQNNFRLLSDEDKEKWKCFQAYLHYIYKSKKIKSIRTLIQNSKINFKLSEYVDDRPPFNKEQRGLNIAILSSQILFYLDRWDLDGISDCIQALAPYCRRYPKKDINYRGECFITMLREMQKEDFRFYQTRKNTEKIYQEIVEMPLEYQGGFRSLEVLPYESMWEYILEKLKNYRYG